MPGDALSKKLAKLAQKRHRYRVVNAKSVVDHHPPALHMQKYFQLSTLHNAAERLLRIDHENKKLVQRINVIYRTMGMVDSHMRSAIKPESNIAVRLRQAKTITAHNKVVYKRILNAEATMKTADLERDWERIEKVLEARSKNPLCWKKKQVKEEDKHDEHLRLEIEKSGLSDYEMSVAHKLMRPRVFFVFMGPGDSELGQIDVELFRDVVPKTVENFLSLCIGTDDEEKLCYRNTPIFRINTGLYCLGGDVTKRNGTGGRSIYGEEFPAENFEIQHSHRGMLSMITHKNMCSSQFMITFQALHTLDKKNVVFGRIIKGLPTLQTIEGFGTRNGRPLKQVNVVECGQIDY